MRQVMTTSLAAQPDASPSTAAAAAAGLVRERLLESAQTKAALAADETTMATVAAVALALLASLRRGGQVLLFGNGGSSTDAQHLAAELVGRFGYDRPALPALCLSDSGAAVTAIANDYSYADVFARQVQAHGRPGDVAVGLSTSGTSPSVLRALDAAHARGLLTVGLGGGSGGQLRERCDHVVLVPSSVTARIQECHLAVGHALCEIVETELFPRAAPAPPLRG